MRAIFTIILAALPFLGIGFFTGLHYAKASYFQTIRWQQKQIRHIQRHTQMALNEAVSRGYQYGMEEARRGR